ncbi:MAG TPA: polyphenol oxidase family protein [Limnobacter sp.]|nr:polyphenol oxidase family protein [Limnobacter sp.]
MKIEPLLYVPALTGPLSGLEGRLRIAVTLRGAGLQVHPWIGEPYGFNFGDHVGDNPVEVALRRQALEMWVGAPIVWLNQVHGCAVVDPSQMNPGCGAPQADASITCSSQHALAIMTADCLPVVFVAIDGSGCVRGVGAAHAGWRGLRAGVLRATARALAHRCGVPTRQIHAWLGPAIGPQSFEVGEEVRQAFIDVDPDASACFADLHHGTGKSFADIYALATRDLMQAGVTDVQGGGADTFTDLRWFSHRRGQQQGVQAGRMATVIRLLP